MAPIRFLHTDYLRLGTPLSGLDQSPAWMQKLTAGATRQAVRNIIETAVARDVDFLFIAGSVTESESDLPSAAAWLDTQLTPLRECGIKTVAVADSRTTTHVLAGICDVVVGREQLLNVTRHVDGTVSFRVSETADANADVVLTASSAPVMDAVKLHYQALPTRRPGTAHSRVDADGRTVVSAGASQAVSPEETWECGCVLCEVDVSERLFRLQTLHSDVVRFASEKLNFTQQATPDGVVAEVLRASDAIQNRATQTVIMDWSLRCDVMAGPGDVGGLIEVEMLSALREQLEAGHRGVWPRSIRFSGDSTLKVSSDGNAAVEEFIDVTHGPVSTVAVDISVSPKVCLAGQNGIPEKLLHGISLISRAA